jgi:transposase
LEVIVEKELYPSDLTDRQWKIIEPLLPKRQSPRGAGRTGEVCIRAILKTIFYLVRTAVSGVCRLVSIPKWRTFYHSEVDTFGFLLVVIAKAGRVITGQRRICPGRSKGSRAMFRERSKIWHIAHHATLNPRLAFRF